MAEQDNQQPPILKHDHAPDPNKKKVMYGVLGLAGVVLLYVYFKNKNSASTAASTVTTGGAIDPLTGQPYQPGVGSLSATGSGLQGMGSGGNIIIKNIIPGSGGKKSSQPPVNPGGPSGPSTTTTPAIITPSATPSSQQASVAAAQNIAVANKSNPMLAGNPSILFSPSGQATNVGVGTGRSATTGLPAFTGYPTTGPNAVPYSVQHAYGWM